MKKNGESIYGCGISKLEKPDWGRYTQKGDIIYAHVYETPLGALPLYGIGPDKLESVTYLADGSEVNRGEAWNTVLYPDVAFVSFGDDPVFTYPLPDEKDMVLIGYLAFLDPAKESTAPAIKALKEHGVATKILTGDNEKVTKAICQKVGLNVENILLGQDVAKMGLDKLKEVVETTTIFAKLSPEQKALIIKVLKENGHSVGYMGDGINDALALKASDVGISVDSGVDIAKEAADVILLDKDLMVLEKGLVEGRKVYANMIKYIKMTDSSNFGNMFSVLIASAFLPFLPMAPIQLLLLNLIYDIACITLPFDRVDEEYLKIPRTWEASSIGRFMLWMGPISSIFDIMTYVLMFYFIAPIMAGGSYQSLTNPDRSEERRVGKECRSRWSPYH